MIDRVVELVNELNEIVDTYRLSIEVDCLGRNKVLVLNKNEFFNQFTEFDIDYQNDQEYPYKASIEIDGVYFSQCLIKKLTKKYVKGVRKDEIS